jgi:hypothetical protein
MDHRYGRHGPHAWRRWRERRFAHRSLDVIHVNRAAVLHIHVTSEGRERIFVVLVGEDGIQIGKIKEATIVNALPPGSEPEKTPFYSLAALDADEFAERYLQGVEDPPHGEQLRDIALKLGRKRIREFIYSRGASNLDYDEALNIYVSSFIKIGNEHLVNGGANISDKETWEVRKVACRDKRDDATSPLLPHQIAIKAVLRAHEYLEFQPRYTVDYLDQINRIAKIYQARYDEYNPEQEKGVDRSSRSDLF